MKASLQQKILFCDKMSKEKIQNLAKILQEILHANASLSNSCCKIRARFKKFCKRR